MVSESDLIMLTEEALKQIFGIRMHLVPQIPGHISMFHLSCLLQGMEYF